MSSSPDAATEAAWTSLKAAAHKAAGVRIAELFEHEPDRLQRLTVEAAGLTLDLSKQTWSLEALDAALDLARAAGVEERRAWMFAGDRINTSENRAALHMALRAAPGEAWNVDGEPVTAAVIAVRDRMRAFAEEVRAGRAVGATGRPFRHIVHLGIGGSDLGPRLLWDALRPVSPDINLHFVANVDGAELTLALAGLDPAETLVVVVSKTFGTQETLANAAAARAWLVAGVGEAAVGAHLAAVSTALDRTAAFGIRPERVFGFWDWVGGRYSLWSAVSLSVAIALGWDRFEALLEGAREMDRHFMEAPLGKSAPVLLALAQVFNRNGLNRPARSVVPYIHRLNRLPSFLQQLEMESNGKRVSSEGRPLTRATAPVVFGGEGANVQHAYFQQMHQGTDVVPLEFIVAVRNDDSPAEMQTKLLANCLAQAEALMQGRREVEVRAELEASGVGAAEIARLAPQRTFPGNRPSTLIVMQRLTPQALGALIALYEHKTFVEGVLWDINSFDQWGVELGKTLTTGILEDLRGGPARAHDPSTVAWIARLKR